MESANKRQQPSLFGPGVLPGSAARLDAEWREVEVPAEILAEMLGCRQTNLRQNYGEALVPSTDRGLYRLETVARAVERLRTSGRGKRGKSTEDELEYQRLRNEKIRADTHKTRCATRDFVRQLKEHVTNEVLDELADPIVALRDEVRALPAELVDAFNRWVETMAEKIEAKRRVAATLSEEDLEAVRDLRLGE